MTKSFTATMSYDATCIQVFAMMTNADYVAAKLNGTGGFDLEISVDVVGSDTQVKADRKLPAQIPSFAKKFTGETIQVVEVDMWSPADEFGARTATVSLDFLNTPARADGHLDLHPAGNGCEVKVKFDVKASIPFVAGKIETVIAEQIERAIRQENKIGMKWLADNPTV